MTTKKTICDRCGTDISQRVGKIYSQLFHHVFIDDFGDKVEMDLCYDCDWDVMNGDDPFKSRGDVNWERAERLHEYNPTFFPPP